MKNEQAYSQLVQDMLAHVDVKDDRTITGTHTRCDNHTQLDVLGGFLLLTHKRVAFCLIASELLWLLRGDTNSRYLIEHNNNIWNEWAFEKWIKSDLYNGADMTDFGIRAQQDATFKETYTEQMAYF